MKNLEIKVLIDSGNLDEVNAAIAFLKFLTNGSPQKDQSGPGKIPATGKIPSSALEEEMEIAKKRMARKVPSKDPDPAPEDIEVKDPEVLEPKAPEPKNPAKVSLDDIRTALSKKVADHKDAIKDQLTSIGAKNVSTIPEEEKESFLKFLTSL